jgi:hypothetical protein
VKNTTFTKRSRDASVSGQKEFVIGYKENQKVGKNSHNGLTVKIERSGILAVAKVLFSHAKKIKKFNGIQNRKRHHGRGEGTRPRLLGRANPAQHRKF